jgi:hypothetical protein
MPGPSGSVASLSVFGDFGLVRHFIHRGREVRHACRFQPGACNSAGHHFKHFCVVIAHEPVSPLWRARRLLHLGHLKPRTQSSRDGPRDRRRPGSTARSLASALKGLFLPPASHQPVYMHVCVSVFRSPNSANRLLCLICSLNLGASTRKRRQEIWLNVQTPTSNNKSRLFIH